MANPFFSGRIPQSLYDSAEEFIKQSGKTKTEILIEALAAYLNHPVEIKKPVGNEELWNTIRELQERVAVIEKTSVIGVDNNKNITTHEQHSQLSLLEVESLEEHLELEVTPKKTAQIVKTNEIPNLPGLENEDATEIKTRARNTKALGKKVLEVGHYILKLVGKEPGQKGSLLWEVTEK